ncbi:DUF1992 domain-containing protein [Virgisporangium ochraceum]|uniref:DUF1992 domain-containing protein n=1 Tax=Virgisporangium ochraceum TaxID=65505 RepID=A0A8J4EAX2_9ACTN|nr:DUF1992 domain-containing protein [Virgisporangium ochraceum]GIJ67989.1 DUF1992 domain-containing protein [Virgisporangium ochraceum]
MTERRPAGVNFETWIDRQIREAGDRGEFDNLPGAGKPLPGAGQLDNENWWLNGYLRREGVTGDTLLPPAVLLRREAEELPSVVRRMRSEAEVRETVADLNRRIVEFLRQPSELRISVRPVNVDRIVEEWRAQRPADPPAGSPAADPEVGPDVPRRGWWRRRR